MKEEVNGIFILRLDEGMMCDEFHLNSREVKGKREKRLQEREEENTENQKYVGAGLFFGENLYICPKS